MALWLWIIEGIITLAVLTIIFYYNRLTVLSNRVDNSLSQIDVQLKRRADLIPNLLETVKGYTRYEKKIIDSVTEARKALMGAGTLSGKIKADQKLETSLKSLFALAENYPDLRQILTF